MNKITNRDIKRQDKEIIEVFGFLRFSINARYGYHAVDQHSKNRPECTDCVWITSITKKNAYIIRNAMLTGAYTVKES